ncbi:hypothetical protein [Gordonia sp. CPCC 205333]|uniref:hypothetical protein n=1 Tax=Gordonia sp. CPCC 205333 TaxID=3140790 RepID=UPI003AF3BDD5
MTDVVTKNAPSTTFSASPLVTYRGNPGNSITIEQAGIDGCRSENDPILQPGKKYLLFLQSDRASNRTVTYTQMWTEGQTPLSAQQVRAAENSQPIPGLQKVVDSLPKYPFQK